MQKRALSIDDLGLLFLFAAILLGTWFRLYIPFNAGAPIGDGGLFFAMVKAVQQNHYRLPEFIQYNGLEIPFAYPPFGFYVAGLIADLFHISTLNVLLWLPASVMISTIIAIYFLAIQLLKSKFKAGLASFLYALLPGSISWLIMGGGITRSFGQLFLMLATINNYLLFSTRQRKYIAYSIFSSGLVCLSHPEATIHTISVAFILWLFYGRNKDGVLNALMVVIGTLLFTSPWWITTLLRFGLSPYLSASQTGFSEAVIFLAPLVSFSQEAFLPILSMLAIFGIALSIAKRDYLLPVLYIVPFLVESRNATNVYIIPLALLASTALSEMLLPALARIEGTFLNREFTIPLQSRAEKFLLAYVMIILILGMQVSGMKISKRQVSPDIRTAFDWIKTNTAKESSFLVLTGITGQLNDFVNEWFPVLTQRRSATTIQGLEWMGNNLFAEQRSMIATIQTCRSVPKIVECIENNPDRSKFKYDYIMITADLSYPALKDLIIDHNYKTVYYSNEVLILQKLTSVQP